MKEIKIKYLNIVTDEGERRKKHSYSLVVNVPNNVEIEKIRTYCVRQFMIIIRGLDSGFMDFRKNYLHSGVFLVLLLLIYWFYGLAYSIIITFSLSSLIYRWKKELFIYFAFVTLIFAIFIETFNDSYFATKLFEYGLDSNIFTVYTYDFILLYIILSVFDAFTKLNRDKKNAK